GDRLRRPDELETAASGSARRQRPRELAAGLQHPSRRAVSRLHAAAPRFLPLGDERRCARRVDRKSTRLNSSHSQSPYAVCCLKIARAIPGLAFGLFGGVVADRADRRRLLIVTQSSAAILATVLGVLTISGSINIVEVVLISAL